MIASGGSSEGIYTAVRTDVSFIMRSISRMRFDGRDSDIWAGAGSHPLTVNSSVPMASRAELERPKTIKRYF